MSRRINQSNYALIEEYKEKINSFGVLAVEYKELKKENEIIKTELQQKENTLKELKINNHNLKIELQNQQREVENINEYFKNKLKQLKEQADFEKDKALLENDKKHHENIQQIRDKCDIKVQELLEKLEQLQNEYIELNNKVNYGNL